MSKTKETLSSLLALLQDGGYILRVGKDKSSNFVYGPTGIHLRRKIQNVW